MNMVGGIYLLCIEIIDKEIIYCSLIYWILFFILIIIDIEVIEKFVRNEYDKVNVGFEDIKIGVVIIIGEIVIK